MYIFASHFEREGVALVGFGVAQWLECQVCRFCRGCHRNGHPFFINPLKPNTMKRFKIIFLNQQYSVICCHWKECDDIMYAVNYVNEIKQLYDDIVDAIIIKRED